MIGPAGTPDNGYALLGGKDYDFYIGVGSMYVGGIRVELDNQITYSDQPDWLDHLDDPAWVPLGPPADNEHVVLVIEERDVTAIEDPALREPALGGPDGAARTRLLQHTQRLPAAATDCADALTSDQALWANQGLEFDPTTMRLDSMSRLHVTWQGTPNQPNPCEPTSTGGYLGAENQLIRIQVTEVDTKTGTFDLVWGYDNASFLYRVTADASTDPVLTLKPSPVDDYHRPRAGQAVQLLRSAATLDTTDGTTEGYVASADGPVAALTARYDPDAGTVQFPNPNAALPAWYTDPTQTPQLYLRVWEEQITGSTLGTPITLTGTGIQITLTTAGSGPLHVGDFWSIAVRPNTPTEVYPDRYLLEPQPPEGPRLWACPLAVITWDVPLDPVLAIKEDCRRHFEPLVDCACCCTLHLHPSDARAGRIQHLIDQTTAGRSATDRSSRLTICLTPGRYELQQPIVLQAQHSNLILRACSDGAVLAAAAGSEDAFVQGLIVLIEASNVTISGLELDLPQVPLAAIADVNTAIGIRPVNCATLEISDCLFQFGVGDPTTPSGVFGVGVWPVGSCIGFRMRDNQFRQSPPVTGNTQGSTPDALYGYLLMPINSTNTPSASLADAVITDNVFDGISAGIVVVAELGTVRTSHNTILRSYGGIWILDDQAQSAVGGQVRGAIAEQGVIDRAAATSGSLDPLLLLANVIAWIVPPPGSSPSQADNPVPTEQPTNVVAGDHTRHEWITKLAKAVEAQFTPLKTTTSGAKPPASTEADVTPGIGGEDPATPKETPFEQLLRLARGLTWAPPNPGIRRRQLQLRVEHNDVDCGIVDPSARLQQVSGAALYVLVTPGFDTSAVLDANRLHIPGLVQGARVLGVPAASVLGVTTQTITGNIIGTANPGSYSLIVAELADERVPRLSITGNVIEGPTNLQKLSNPPAPQLKRPFQTPLDTWLPLNTVLP
ncbi:hypothetical protein FK531_14270 [Rhodococcus spelaei]|uniref:Right handed beta helix domain-containing protein n=2 Tax=Rhodococcus spelaei TaxID=2546320 RepID=A0A541B7G6_9NOCA|nr:hypothetical protein FK531_14270 [Rhodococcus spelaei]